MTGGDSLIIGVDGGGTSCRAALRLGAGGARVVLAGGAANVSDFDRAIATIRDTILALIAKAGLEPAALAHARAHLGLAGVTGPAMASRVERTLSAMLPFARLTVSGDAPTMAAGALGPVAGAVAGIGTGSFVCRRTGSGVHTLGGHGFLLGDQASGAWLGLRALQETMLAADGIGSRTPLADALLANHGQDRAAVVAFAIAARPADFAALAPRVLAAAQAGDALGQRLMREGADYIAQALAALGWTAAEPLCLTGGLGPAYRDWLPAGIAAAVVAAKGNALDGALILAEAGS
jgi:glucosamine kinase